MNREEMIKKTWEDQSIFFRLIHDLRAKGKHDGTLLGLKDLFERQDLMKANYFKSLNL